MIILYESMLFSLLFSLLCTCTKGFCGLQNKKTCLNHDFCTWSKILFSYILYNNVFNKGRIMHNYLLKCHTVMWLSMISHGKVTVTNLAPFIYFCMYVTFHSARLCYDLEHYVVVLKVKPDITRNIWEYTICFEHRRVWIISNFALMLITGI